MHTGTEPGWCLPCQRLTQAATVKTNIWLGERLIVVEDIPAHICDKCGEQYYSDVTTEALRGLVQDELDTVKPKRDMVVSVYSLEGRIRRLPEPPPSAEGYPEPDD